MFRSYLSNRKQYVYCNGVSSCHADLDTGVPQGSILGPILFSVYMNDFKKCTSLFHFILYADDTTLYTDFKKHDHDAINHALDKVITWLDVNKLSLNVKKSKMMIFYNRKKPITPDIKLNNIPVEEVDNFKFLGITIDNTLSWNTHTSLLATKLSKAVFVLNRLKHFMPMCILYYITHFFNPISSMVSWPGVIN